MGNDLIPSIRTDCTKKRTGLSLPRAQADVAVFPCLHARATLRFIRILNIPFVVLASVDWRVRSGPLAFGFRSKQRVRLFLGSSETQKDEEEFMGLLRHSVCRRCSSLSRRYFRRCLCHIQDPMDDPTDWAQEVQRSHTLWQPYRHP